MSRRRSGARLLVFGGSLLAGALGWAALREPDGSAGAAGFMVLGELVLPGLALCALCVQGVGRDLFRTRQRRISLRKAASRARLDRPPVPARLKRTVLAAYRGRCVYCRVRRMIQFEHINPYSLGFLTWFPNMTLLCAACNEIKSSYWKDRRTGWEADGHGRVNLAKARAIRDRERRARRNPLVWWRASWAWFG